MRARRPEARRPPALLLGALLASACASRSPAPTTWQVPASEVDQSPRGAWANVSLRGGGGLSGELLAVDDRSVYLGLSPRLTRVPNDCIITVQLAAFENPAKASPAIGLVGALSTVSHGIFLVFSAPIWIITAGISTYVESGAGHPRYGQGEDSLQWASAWARFPAGLPTGFIDRVPEREVLDVTCNLVKLGGPR